MVSMFFICLITKNHTFYLVFMVFRFLGIKNHTFLYVFRGFWTSATLWINLPNLFRSGPVRSGWFVQQGRRCFKNHENHVKTYGFLFPWIDKLWKPCKNYGFWLSGKEKPWKPCRNVWFFIPRESKTMKTI